MSRDRGKVFDEIADGTIAIEKIESSDFYKKIEQRIHFLPLLELKIIFYLSLFLNSSQTKLTKPYNSQAKVMPAIYDAIIFINSINNFSLKEWILNNLKTIAISLIGKSFYVCLFICITSIFLYVC